MTTNLTFQKFCLASCPLSARDEQNFSRFHSKKKKSQLATEFAISRDSKTAFFLVFVRMNTSAKLIYVNLGACVCVCVCVCVLTAVLAFKIAK